MPPSTNEDGDQPEFRVNPAIRIRGEYQIGSRESLNQAVAGGFPIDAHQVYINTDAYGVHRTFADGQWSELWVSVQIPWGVLVYGKRPGPFGLGLQYDNETPNLNPYWSSPHMGPFRFGAFWYPVELRISRMIWHPSSR